MDALHELHLVAGLPSTRDLERDIGSRGATSHAAIHKIFTGSSRPTWQRLERLVEVMARRAKRDEKTEVERFRTLWAQAARPGSKATEPEAPVSVRAEGGMPGVEAETEQLSQPISRLLGDALDEIEAVGSAKATGSFRIPTGFADLDALLGGWSQGCLIVIGGRPSSGKTTLLLNLCRAASIIYQVPSMLISGEMNSTEIQTRILSAQARVPLLSIRNGYMREEEWARLARILVAVGEAPIHIGTLSEFQIEKISAEAARLTQKSGVKLLLIDSLQWITAHAVSGRTSAAAETSLWKLKNLATTLKIPIIVTAQAKKFPDIPREGDAIQYLRDSSAIEQVADIVIMLYRPDQDEPETPRAGEADFMVVKNRTGPTATITVAYQYHFCRFVDMAV